MLVLGISVFVLVTAVLVGNIFFEINEDRKNLKQAVSNRDEAIQSLTGFYKTIVDLQNRTINIWRDMYGETFNKLIDNERKLNDCYDFHEKIFDSLNRTINIWRDMYDTALNKLEDNERELNGCYDEVRYQEHLIKLKDERIKELEQILSDFQNRIDRLTEETEKKEDKIRELNELVEEWRRAVEDGEEWKKGSPEKKIHPEDDPNFEV